MGTDRVRSALREVQGILKTLDASVTFCSCDASVHSLTQVESLNELLSQIKGGGGTDFCPAFDALDRAKPRPEVVIFATDGYGPAPHTPPRGMQTVWLLIGKDAPCPANWGKAVKVDSPDDD
jgi:predicted metal-dependent peptidase